MDFAFAEIGEPLALRDYTARKRSLRWTAEKKADAMATQVPVAKKNAEPAKRTSKYEVMKFVEKMKQEELKRRQELKERPGRKYFSSDLRDH